MGDENPNTAPKRNEPIETQNVINVGNSNLGYSLFSDASSETSLRLRSARTKFPSGIKTEFKPNETHYCGHKTRELTIARLARQVLCYRNEVNSRKSSIFGDSLKALLRAYIQMCFNSLVNIMDPRHVPRPVRATKVQSAPAATLVCSFGILFTVRNNCIVRQT